MPRMVFDEEIKELLKESDKEDRKLIMIFLVRTLIGGLIPFLLTKLGG